MWTVDLTAQIFPTQTVHDRAHVMDHVDCGPTQTVHDRAHVMDHVDCGPGSPDSQQSEVDRSTNLQAVFT